MSVRAVWTDFGGVLTPPVGDTLGRYCAWLRVPVPVFRSAMAEVATECGVTDPMAPLDIPLVDQVTWERRMGGVLARHGYRVDLSGFPDRWFADRAVNAEWVVRLRGLRERGIFVGLLSNMPPAWDPYWRLMTAPADLFDGVVLSFEVGCRKPEAAMFAVAAQRSGVPAGECLLVDDLPANCAGARAAGWHAVEFQDAASAGDAVEAVAR